MLFCLPTGLDIWRAWPRWNHAKFYKAFNVHRWPRRSVSNYFTIYITRSLARSEHDLQISGTSMQQILRRIVYMVPNRINLVRNLEIVDYEVGLHYTGWGLRNLRSSSSLFLRIMSSDHCAFHATREVNKIAFEFEEQKAQVKLTRYLRIATWDSLEWVIRQLSHWALVLRWTEYERRELCMPLISKCFTNAAYPSWMHYFPARRRSCTL